MPTSPAENALLLVLFICGSICALWAQNTRRNSWLWFFFGFFGAFIALLALLWTNSRDLAAQRLKADVKKILSS